MMRPLEVLALLALACVSLSQAELLEGSAQRELHIYKTKIQIIYNLLIAECPSFAKTKRASYDLLSADLRVEKAHYNRLLQELIRCQSSNGRQTLATTTPSCKHPSTSPVRATTPSTTRPTSTSTRSTTTSTTTTTTTTATTTATTTTTTASTTTKKPLPCPDGVNVTMNGTITSPNYPADYPNDADITWDICVPEGYIIEFTFPHEARLENYRGCSSDKLEFYSKRSNYIFARVCGVIKPQCVYYTYSNYGSVHFISDFGTTFPGWKMHWQAVTTCGENYTNLNNGTIVSPNYPQSIQGYFTCNWNIQVAEEYAIKLTFPDETNLEYSCSSKFIEIYKNDSSKELIRKFCQRYLKAGTPVATNTNSISIKFSNVRSSGGPKWKLHWEVVKKT